jgi:hypothetical protein
LSTDNDWLFAYFFFGLLFVIVVLVVQLLQQRRQVIALSRRIDALTAIEAHVAAVPREQIRARLRRPGETLGRTIGIHDVDELPRLVRSWVPLQLPDLELKPGERLEIELLSGDLDLFALFNVTAWSRRA